MFPTRYICLGSPHADTKIQWNDLPTAKILSSICVLQLIGSFDYSFDSKQQHIDYFKNAFDRNCEIMVATSCALAPIQVYTKFLAYIYHYQYNRSIWKEKSNEISHRFNFHVAVCLLLFSSWLSALSNLVHIINDSMGKRRVKKKAKTSESSWNFLYHYPIQFAMCIEREQCKMWN